MQHMITISNSERKIPTGASFYVPVASLDMSNTLDITDEDQVMFGDFLSWVDNYNDYIVSKWAEKANSHMDDEDVDVVDAMVDIEVEEEVA
jgi:hypothetical protein